jgi:hypothetical protein
LLLDVQETQFPDVREQTPDEHPTSVQLRQYPVVELQKGRLAGHLKLEMHEAQRPVVVLQYGLGDVQAVWEQLKHSPVAWQ